MRDHQLHKLSRLLHLVKLSWRNMDVTNLNIFVLCKCLRHAGKIMLLIVVGLVGLIWTSVLINAFVPGLKSSSAGAQALWGLGLVLYSTLIFMILWSYLATFWTDPGLVPPGWSPFPDEEAAAAELGNGSELQRLAQPPPSGAGPEAGRAYLERPRFCKKCQCWKPPRAHHCSMTGRCVLRMDHFCVWVLNCVGLLNYKHFVLFLGYTMLGCMASTGLLVKPCIAFFSFKNPSVGRTIVAFISFVFSAAFSLALLGFLIMHLRLIATNHTTIEAYEKRPIRPWPYNRGRGANFAEVFGRGPWWRRLAPLHSQEDRRAMLARYLGSTSPRGSPNDGSGSRGAGGGGSAPQRWGSGAEQQLCLSGGGSDSEHML